MRILFMGTPDFAERSLKELYDRGYDVCGVFTQPDKPKNRGMKPEESPVKKLALSHGTPVFQPAKMRDGEAMGIIRELAPDLIAVVAYGKILPADILEYPRYGCVNIHGSLLPKYRGAAPIQWAVLNGDKVTGVTSMFMAEAMDAGDIIFTRETEILPDETSGELFDRLSVMGAELLCETVDAIGNGTAPRTPQNHEEATLAPMIDKSLCPIDWSKGGDEILNRIRGLDPWPVATAEFAGQKIKVYKAKKYSCDTKGMEPGTVIPNKDGVEVVCGDGTMLITELQAPGKRRMNAADYLRGHRLW
ncbi:MAG: methionyl-tRNA formyltransferase [Oscillospiraceae bacterium]|nr:methionyl-tRNA formyltransferase [Oscillospiraceae bacterium]